MAERTGKSLADFIERKRAKEKRNAARESKLAVEETLRDVVDEDPDFNLGLSKESRDLMVARGIAERREEEYRARRGTPGRRKGSVVGFMGGGMVEGYGRGGDVRDNPNRGKTY